MSSPPAHVVWFKRDLRVEDHRPLVEAAERGRVLPLYIFEPSIITAPDFDRQHFDFIRESLEELRGTLAQIGAPLIIRVGEAVPVLDVLKKEQPFTHIWSHMETGNDLTYQRDRAVAAWAADAGVAWTEIRQHGVERGTIDRDGWQKRWNTLMSEPLKAAPEVLRGFPSLGNEPVPDFQSLEIREHHPAVTNREPDLLGGSSEAHKWLDSFLAGRGANYSKELSSPNTAYASCSRMSPYLAWGCISMRTIHQAMTEKRDEVRAIPAKERGDLISLGSLKAFDARLHWHCHFIQKLESEPEIEFNCFNASCESLRQPGANAERLEAWMNARTGYPFVDACMRSLQTRGWINFRMRAMLVSFAAYDLWLDWRDLKDFLACQFIDYEPGIHYSQLQMQSGTTGINTLRMYNPVKQGTDHDPDGAFIRRWIPELNDVPDDFIHTPWEAPLLNPDSYPPAIVDHKEAVAEARSKFKSLRGSDEHKDEAKRVYKKHGSRKRPSRKKTVTNT